MKTKIITAIFVLSINIAYCQEECSHFEKKDLTPVSPTASALGKYVDNPVSLYTGTPNITIPIYNIEMKEVSIPINLSYNPKNIQPENSASNVGLGWSLNAGGVITRAVKDAPDDWHKTDNQFTNHVCSGNSTPVGTYQPFVWGYLYATTQTIDTDWFPTLSTYHYDLDAIYDNYEEEPRSLVYDFLWGICFETPYCENPYDGSSLYRQYRVNSQYNNRRFNSAFHFVVDKEPDIFYFNFNGYSGKFVFDVEHGTPTITTVPYQDLKFSYQTDEDTKRLIGFTIIDPNGVQYNFQDYEVSTYYNNHNVIDQGYTPNSCGMEHIIVKMAKGEYNSSWWLSQIITPQGEIIDFEYETEAYKLGHNVYNPSYKSVEMVNTDLDEPLASLLCTLCDGDEGVNDDTDCDFYHCGIINSKMVNVSAKRLTNIHSDYIDISFSANHTREDLFAANNAKAITDIEINSNFPTNHRIKKVKLEYDYFLTDQVNQYDFIEYEIRDAPVISDLEPAKKRLRLKAMQEYGITDNDILPATVFEYNYYDYNGDNTTKFPNRLTFNIDLWGYANGADNTVPIPELNIYPDHYDRGDMRMFSVYKKEDWYGRYFTKRGGDRLPNADYMDIGILTKITYPTGGSTTYEYEPHRFVVDGEEEIGGGLRIAQIIKDNAQGSKMHYKYLYTNDDDNRSSGKIVSLPIFATLSVSKGLVTAAYSGGDEALLNKYANYFSYPLNVLGQTHGSNVGYSKVVEYQTESVASITKDNGYTEYVYSFPADFGKMNDVLGSRCSIESNGICDGLYATTRVHNFFVGQSFLDGGYDGTRGESELSYFPESSLAHLLPPNPNYDWNRGHLLKKNIYDANDNPVKKEDYEYEIYYPNGRTSPNKVYGLKFAPFHSDVDWCDGNCFYGIHTNMLSFRVANYEILTDVAKVLSSKTVTDYGTDGSSISKTTSYKHEGICHKNTTEISEDMSSDDKLVRKYLYSGDFKALDFPNFESENPNPTLNKLIQQNRLNIPFEISEYIKKGSTEYLRGSALAKYSLVNDNAYPNKQHKIETNTLLTDFQNSIRYDDSWIDNIYMKPDDRYVEKVHYKNYDSKGNVTEIEDKTSGLTTSFIWGYRQQYPIAQIVNATYSEIEAVIGTTDMGWLMLGYIQPTPFLLPDVLSDTEIRDMLAPLRTSLPDAQVTTYTYKPLVGMTSETDISGRTTYYEYDNFNRLKLIKDHEGNILKQYEYHYKNQ
jgi:hypothetical protein